MRVTARLTASITGSIPKEVAFVRGARGVPRCAAEGDAHRARADHAYGDHRSRKRHRRHHRGPRHQAVRISGSDTLPGQRATLQALVLLAEISEYQSRLKALTGGQGAYTMELSHYDPVPPRKQQELATAWRPRGGAGIRWP